MLYFGVIRSDTHHCQKVYVGEGIQYKALIRQLSPLVGASQLRNSGTAIIKKPQYYMVKEASFLLFGHKVQTPFPTLQGPLS